MRRILGYTITRPGRTAADSEVFIPIAKDLQKIAGIPRRDNEESYYNREYPLESVAVTESASSQWAAKIREESHPETVELYNEHNSKMEPVIEWIRTSGDLQPTAEPTGENVTDAIRQKARELGYAEVGFVRFDRRYVYQSRRKDLKNDLPHAICLALEQDYDATQTIPSLEAEAAQGETYRRQGELSMQLVEHINGLGYRAQVSGPTWQFGPLIPMFVDAGLGQLGVNGQLLSPHFGSRARLQIILTNAIVSYDKPVDYGIYKFCESCQICVMRCPGRALEGQRIWYRGVEKNKLTFQRCRPVMTRYDGCGICMKTCPIQKYGLKPVMDYYLENGEVLGKTTDNLEGYTLPDKGYFPSGKLPTFNREFFEMPRGTAEDNIMDSLREAVSGDNDQSKENAEELWTQFREEVESNAKGKPEVVDMGMDIIG